MWDWIVNWVSSAINSLTDWVSSAIDSVYSWASSMWGSLVGWVSSAIDSVYNWLSSAWSSLVDWVNSVLSNIKQVYNTFVNYITNVYETVVNNITNVYETTVNSITNIIGVTIDKVADWFESIGGATRAWAEGLFVKVKEVWNTITGDLNAWWKTQLALLRETFGWILPLRDNIEGFFGDPAQWIYDRLDDFFERFW